MIIRNILLILFASVLAGSCKKDSSNDTGGGTTVEASTMLNVAYGTDPLQKMDIYLPAARTEASTKVIVLIHGGAYLFGDKADFTSYVDTLKRRLPKYAIFNINYRLATPPTNVFPTQENDVKAAMDFIAGKTSEYLVSTKFALMGASAGAHLALLQAYKYSSPVKPKAVIDFFGPTNINDLYDNPGIITASQVESIAGGTPTSNPDIYQQSSPINFATTGAACPTLILQGADDPLVNANRQSGALYGKLQMQLLPVEYISYPGKGHGDDWDSATYQDAFERVQSFLAQYNP
jgi:acetyl esterase/lipase